MNFLLDTSVVSELRKSEHRIDSHVRDWVIMQSPADLYLSVITIMEIEVGIGRLQDRDPQQATRLQRWLEESVLPEFAHRVLPIDVRVARYAAAMHVPDPRPERDVLIAATAMANGLTVATRNTSDFRLSGLTTIDPWQEPRTGRPG